MSWSPLLDTPAYPSELYGKLADRLAAILKTRSDVVIIQGEAIIALEAAAASLARPGLNAINIVTSPYGGWFGDWLRRGGARADDVVAAPGLPVTVEAVAAALDAQQTTDVLAVVHAESASGILNPLPEIVRLARARGAVVVVDAVASIGGHALDVDALGVDIAVIGPQKGLGGSAGLSALSVSPEAWRLIDRPDVPRQSVLSLVDLRRNWIDTGRGALPGMPSALEIHALAATLDRVEEEGIDAIVARHVVAGQASRDGVSALGLAPWVADREASNLVTAGPLPAGVVAADLLKAAAPFGAGLGQGLGSAAHRLVRLNHTGPRARFDVVLANVLAFGHGLTALGYAVDLGAAAAAVTRRYATGA